MVSKLQSHPSVEHLSAYLEGGLPRAQRRQLEGHLCACADCRRLAACAGLLVRQHPPSPRPWALRWQAPLAAAAAAIVAVGLWWLPQSRARVPAPALAAISTAPVPLIHPLPAPVVLRKPHLRRVRLAPAAAPVQLTSAPATAAPLSWAALLPPPPSAPAAATPIVIAAPGFREQAPSLAARPTLAAWGGATPDESAFSNLRLPLAAPVIAAASTSGSAPAAWPYASGFDSGTTPGNATTLAEDLVRTDAMLDAALRTAWNAVPHRTQVHVRILVTQGAREWAGGRADELFTSTDHGVHWQRVLLPGLPAPPPLLRSIAFSDPTHGSITARNGQHWTSSDAGHSWSLQP